MNLTNPDLQLALDYVNETDCHIFLTGKAGTGKTTFLRNLNESCSKRFIVTAPTGVAAINAGGVTLHSFFQMPFGPYLPESEACQQSAKRRFSKEKIKIIKGLDLLVIDEISMVRADLLDGVNDTLRRLRNKDLPFGGVQLLMIGDLYQLSPIIRDEEWELIKDHYDSCYFFSSLELKKTKMVTIELKHIYRQKDPVFIDLLNRVRDNLLDDKTYDLLMSRHLSNRHNLKSPNLDGDDVITLTSHNRIADKKNQQEMSKLESSSSIFTALIEDNFPDHAFPTEEQLELKKGAQVMFVRNDPDSSKLYFNGKMGKVVSIGKNHVVVKGLDDNNEIRVERVVWENIKYTIDEESKEIKEEVVGTFTQLPLRTAWAITIHKSQGLTFDRVIIDAAASFAHGQVYVALSRCKTLDGILLSSPIYQKSIKSDEKVVQFMRDEILRSPTPEQLKKAKILYQQKTLMECFDFKELLYQLNSIARIVRAHQRSIKSTISESVDVINQQVRRELVDIGDRFQVELRTIFNNDSNSSNGSDSGSGSGSGSGNNNDIPEQNPYLQERVKKGALYFHEKLQEGPIKWVDSTNCQAITDNKEVKKRIKKAFSSFQASLDIKLATIKNCQKGYFVKDYHKVRSIASIDTVRSDKVKRKERKKRNKMVTEYCRKHQITTAKISETDGHQNRGLNRNNNKNKSTIGTKEISYNLYIQGKGIPEIAQKRKLAISTITGHLAHYVKLGKLEVTDFISKDKLNTILGKFSAMGTDFLSLIEDELGDDVSYDELHMARNHFQRNNQNKE